MAKKKASKRTAASADGLPPTSDYRHADKRTNLPAAAMASEGEIPRAKRVKYAYSPHLDPVLRFDASGRADRVAAIVEKACKGERLDDGEREILRAVGKNWEQPWLEWAGKQEEHARGHFAVDPVALHIHERISAQAILRAAMREDAERSLFGSAEASYAESLKFYKHDVDWANRLILGDSLQVMSSLAHRENLAGKVQMIYIDPPYGIKFASNFQPEVGKKSVSDSRPDDLTREPEMVRAYRDTWHLGISSYLGYMRDRLIAARDLLSETGSCFVQISDENLHRVRTVLDDVFGSSCFQAQITYRTSVPLKSTGLASICDYVLWYARNPQRLKRFDLYFPRGESESSVYTYCEETTGHRRPIAPTDALSDQVRVFATDNLVSSGYTVTCTFDTEYQGRRFTPSSGKSWKTNRDGMRRLQASARVNCSGDTLRAMSYLEDYPVQKMTALWTDTKGESHKRYVVQTASKVISRCLLMTTEPGDLVMDPTCGSGTTAFVAEQWGRRWITIDTSRVALSIARERLLSSCFDHYRTAAGPQNALGAENPGSGFKYKTVPHITLGAIAQNQNLDPIFAKHEPILTATLKAANDALASVPAALRAKLKEKLAAKQSAEGKKSITDADRRRWILPPDNRDPKEKWTVDAKFTGWYDWEVPFDTDPDWPKPLQDAVTAYRAAWRAKMDEVNKCISDNAEQVELVDQPEVVKGVVRVSGPFTVEGVIPEELSLSETGEVVDLTPNEFEAVDVEKSLQQNFEAYVSRLVHNLRADGVTFPNNKRVKFTRVNSLINQGGSGGVHAEAVAEGSTESEWGIVFGPEYGPVTAQQIELAYREGGKGYPNLVVAGFAFAPEATMEVQKLQSLRGNRTNIQLAHMRPDMNKTMGALLKEPQQGGNQQLFTVFGLPAIDLHKKGDEFTVTLEGVDVFNPVTGTVTSTQGEKVSAWFLDSDYDGRCFCACQAFFPNQDAWEEIARALGTDADQEVFEQFKGRESLPFKRGKHGRVAVKAIDARGNEVMTVRLLDEVGGR